MKIKKAPMEGSFMISEKNRLCGINTLCGTYVCTGAAIDTCIGIDYSCIIFLRNCVNGTFTFAGTAVHAVIFYN